MGKDEIDEEAGDAEERGFTADQRDEVAAERDVAADTRDGIADEREQLANEREVELDARERQLDSEARALGVPPAHTQEEALETLQRAYGATLREAAHQQRDDRTFERDAEDVAREKVKGRRTRSWRRWPRDPGA
jgi:hypothetical protein